MSLYRENVIWESLDGSWHVGFYTVLMPDEQGDDFDPEYDVDYDYTSFEGVYSGPSEEAAWDKAMADRPNPGQSTSVPNAPDNADTIRRLDEMRLEHAR